MSMRVIIMLSRKLHSHLLKVIAWAGFWLDFHYWVVSGLRTSGDWSQGGPRRRCMIGRSSLSAESRSTTSPREEWSRHFVRQGTFPSPPFRIWRTTRDSRDIYPLDPFLGYHTKCINVTSKQDKYRLVYRPFTVSGTIFLRGQTQPNL